MRLALLANPDNVHVQRWTKFLVGRGEVPVSWLEAVQCRSVPAKRGQAKTVQVEPSDVVPQD